MSRNNIEDAKLYGPVFENKVKGGVHIQTLAAALTLDVDTPFMVFLDPGGATRVVTLPTAEKGLMWLVTNTADAVEDLTINNPAAATVGTISQNEAAMVYSDGTNWYCRMVGTTT